MGLKPLVKKYVEERFTCHDFVGPKRVDTLSTDGMMDTKSTVPDHCLKAQYLLVMYFVNKILAGFSRSNIVIFCYDRGSPEVKKLVCHVKRYERRCSLCKKKAALPEGVVAGAEYFDAACQKGCIDNQVLWPELGPHMNENDSDPVMFDWGRFCADSRNLRRELYPRIVDFLMTRWTPEPGQILILHGLPFQQREVFEYDGQAFVDGVQVGNRRVVLDPWRDRSIIPTEADYAETVMFEHGRAPRIVPEMKNDILEADNAVYFYSRFFPQLKTHMAYINDSDAIPIGLFRAMEDLRGQDPDQGPVQWLALPVKSEKVRAAVKGSPGIQYFNLTKLVDRIEEAPEFKLNGVQSPVATVVFLSILPDTDFFKDFCFGVGKKTDWNVDDEKRAKQTQGVWDTFFDNIATFQHLVQYYPNAKSLTTKRRVVIDEDLFRIFTHYCYNNKYSQATARKKKKPKVEVTFEDIRAHCAKSSDPRSRVPDDDAILLKARQLTWNIEYWANAFRNIYIDPFEKLEGVPYYGYERDDAGMRISKVVASKQKPLDEVYKRNFWKRKQQTKEPPLTAITEKSRTAALDAIRGKK